MSKLIKKSTIAAAVGSVLLTAGVSANTANMVSNFTNFEAVKFAAQDTKKNAPTSYLIVLKATSAANLYAQGTYQSGDARATMAQISQLQEALTLELNSLDFNAKVIGQTRILAPTLIVEASKEALAAIEKDARVERVLPMFDSELHIAESSDYIKATPVRTEGLATGMGQKVAVLDTGIDYTHKIFNEAAGTVEAYEAAQADPTTVAWPQGQVKGGYDYMRNDADPIENDPAVPTEENSPTSHGTSVSHSVTGIAPDVELYVYSVCGGGCPSAAQAAALESAMDPNGDGDISDRVDVINMSLGGEFGDTYTGSGVQYLIQRAVGLGVNVVVSAGNDGDHPFRIGGPSTTPNALSVGAMTHPTLEEGIASGTVAGAETVIQAASFGPQGAFTFSNTNTELVYPDANQNGCDAFADDVDFTGKAVLIDRGACAFTTKVLNAQAKGAAFVLVANNNVDGTPAPMGGSSTEITIFSVGVNFQAGKAIKDKLAAGETAEYAIQVVMKNVAGAVADFSSRGPSVNGLLKPEITAPGVNIQVAATGTQDKVAGATGTSFSGPMTAGAVALVREALPERNASEIKATIMNTADLNVTVEATSVNPDSPLAPISLIGAGLVNVDKAVKSPVAAWVYHSEFDTNQAALSFGFENVSEVTAYTKTVTLKNFSSEAKTYNLRTQARYENDAATGAVSWEMPESVTVPAGQTVEFDVTLTIDPAKLPQWKLKNPLNADELAERSPALTLSEFDGALVFDDPNTEGDHDLHLVYHALPKAHVGLKLSYERVAGNFKVALTNNGFKDITPMSEQLVATGTEVSESEKDFNILATTFNAVTADGCDTGVAFTASIMLRDELTHLRRAGGYAMNLDLDNDGTYDYALAQYSDVGRSAIVPGRSRTISGPIVDGASQWAFLSDMYHTSGSNTVTFSGCSDLIGLTSSNLGDTITVEASVGYGYQIGAYDVTDTLTGTTTFATSPATFTNAAGETVVEIKQGETAYINADSAFALTSGELEGVLLPITSSMLKYGNPLKAPVLLPMTISVAENTADDTPIGKLVITDLEAHKEITQYEIQSSTHTAFAINKEGEIVVVNSDELDYELGNNTAKLMVVATDIFGNESKATEIIINIENEIDSAAEYTPPKLFAAEFTVAENTAIDTVVGQLELAVQENTLEVKTYTVKSSSHTTLTVNNKGEVLVAGELDFEAGNNTATLMVIAVDTLGNESKAIKVTVNIENVIDSAAEYTPPKLIAAEFSVAENTTKDTVIGQLKLEAQENTLEVKTYTVKSSSHTALTVNNKGEVLVAGELDFEAGNNTATLMVIAVDTLGNESEATKVTVNIENVIDSAADYTPPKLIAAEFSVEENTATGTVIGQLESVTQENTLEIAEYLVKSSTNTAFSVNNNGQIVVANSAVLDFEAGNNIATLMVIAIDKLGNTSDPAAITINIENVVDTDAEQPAPVPTPTPTVTQASSESSSGSLAWFALLAAPFAVLRRRKHK
ncbi:S8 family serine peptidase [Pseudoalteromonas sp. MMG005]|uniref:S8 family serine peptidase n=1 Tax=Pseudoalteromonas sp. MMG005 TaxID=2822682 RepID=UPI001B3A4228|nr:S8 family serine peptidase [Pseudoalteromonas sp. MMG005]MBQ4845340.1 S8 family serine peptidase [Pseudoalteromonas sp. MMG005]